MAAKVRKRKVRKPNPEDARKTGRFFVITGLIVATILLILFLIFNSL